MSATTSADTAITRRDIGEAAINTLFDAAHTAFKWQDIEVPDSLLYRLYDHVKYAPTSANCSPARFVFLRSEAAKARLLPHLMAGNVAKVKTAPVTAILAYKPNFPEDLPQLFPHDPTAPSWFDDPDLRSETAFRNASLQGGYFILAARALGLDCGPMSGFDKDAVDAEFFAEQGYKTNFICAMGVADPSGNFPRNPRLSFDDAASIL